MLGRISALLMSTVAPVALSAQEVSLRSPDEFLSVDGEIIGFNGVMLRVQTSVGAVSVPASEVICYGEACLDVLASNDFGLTADALGGVVGTVEEAVEETVEVATPSVPTLSGDLSIAFASPEARAFYASLAGAVPGADLSDGSVVLSGGTTMTVGSDLAGADIAVQAVGLASSSDAAFSGPQGWALGTDGMTHQMIGLGAFVVQASPSTGLDSITADDLSRVLSGEVTNWSQIGGSNLPVLALRLPDSAPAYRDFLAVVMEPSGRSVANGVLAMGDEVGIAASVNQFPGSIAVVSAEVANPDLTLPVAGACGLAVMPSAFTVTSGEYPLARPLMASYGGAAPQDLTAFFDVAASDSGQQIAASFGQQSFDAATQDTALKNARLSGLLNATLDDAQRAAAAEMFQNLFSADRMTTTFFAGAVNGPQAGWNRAMMIDLTEALSSSLAGREVVFVGIGTSDQGSQAAISASADAAANMQAAFEAFAGDAIAASSVSLSSYGFGDVAATTCLESPVTGDNAARVEVWVR